MNIKRNLWKIMNVKRNLWKILTALTVAVIAAIFGGSSKALSVETKTLSEQKIESRLANVREQLQARQASIESDSTPSLHKTKEEHSQLLAQWSNWRDTNS